MEAGDRRECSAETAATAGGGTTRERMHVYASQGGEGGQEGNVSNVRGQHMPLRQLRAKNKGWGVGGC